MPTPKPGVYPKVPFDEYVLWDAINHSSLVHFAATPAHARHAIFHQKETPPLTLGHLVHTAVLEPHLIDEEYYAWEKMDKRTKAGKAAFLRAEQESKGRTIVTTEEMECAKALTLHAHQHATLKEMLGSKGANELSIIWEDPELEVLCKGRIDRVCEFQGQSYVLDLKTHGFPATRKSWEKAVEKFGYHQQAAFYLRGLHTLRPMPEDAPERRFAWGVLETSEPYLVKVFDADDEAIELGATQMMRFLATYEECKRTGVWPGWDEGMDLAGLPPWAYKGAQFDG